MIENIKKYQKEYLKILKEFNTHDNNQENDYYFLFDKIELLYKTNKKNIFNYFEKNKDYVFYGGATYFNNKKNEIYPILLAQKRIIMTDPILKLSIFFKRGEMVDRKRIIEIIDRAIEKTLELEKEISSCYIIFIDSNEIVDEIKIKIAETSQELTVQFLNSNLNINCKNLTEINSKYKNYNFDDLEKEFPKMFSIIRTADFEDSETLAEKINNHMRYSGIKTDNMSDIGKILFTLTGLFGQAFELKSISLILDVPLYINRTNVIMYLNCINNISDNDEKNMLYTNIYFAMYFAIKNYNFNSEYESIIDYSKKSKIHEKIIGKCTNTNINTPLDYIDIIKNVINEDNNEKPFEII